MRFFSDYLRMFAALSLCCAAGAAQADLYGYIDEQGVGHFSPEKVDERYQLFIKGDAHFDSSSLTPNAQISEGPAEVKDTTVSRYLLQHPNLQKYDAALRSAANDFTLDPALLKAVMAAESGFNANAVSPKGAVGLMQIMPATAARYGLQADRKRSIAQRLTDPTTNIRIGARYLRDLMRMFPQRLDLVLASYNAGEGAVQRYQNRVPPYPETRNYVQVVSEFYKLYSPPVLAQRKVDMPRRVTMTLPGRRNLPESSGQ